MSVLHGKRILLVEDEYLIAIMAADMLEELGAVVVGPADTNERGLALIESESIDAALLDVNLNGDRSDPIADRLKGRGVPFAFVTGYGARGWPPGALGVEKPYKQEQLVELFSRIFT
jgi:DNA-binding response OmpR family regulator